MSVIGWVVISLAIAVALLALVVAYQACQVADLRAECDDQHDANHAKCIAHIADFTSKRVVAMAFRDAAERYGSPEEQAAIARMARTEWSSDGPSIPAIWMDKQADLLDPPTTPEIQSAYSMADIRRMQED